MTFGDTSDDTRRDLHSLAFEVVVLSSDHDGAYHELGIHEQPKAGHCEHADVCNAGFCCVMDYEHHLKHRSDKTARNSGSLAEIVEVHTSLAPLVPDRPPQHS